MAIVSNSTRHISLETYKFLWSSSRDVHAFRLKASGGYIYYWPTILSNGKCGSLFSWYFRWRISGRWRKALFWSGLLFERVQGSVGKFLTNILLHKSRFNAWVQIILCMVVFKCAHSLSSFLLFPEIFSDASVGQNPSPSISSFPHQELQYKTSLVSSLTDQISNYLTMSKLGKKWVENDFSV